jgi:hypothetical protein
VVAESFATLIRSGYDDVAEGMTAGAIAGGLGGSVVPGAGNLAGAMQGGKVGAQVGTGKAAYNMELYASVMDGLAEAGVDISDPNALKTAFSNKEFMSPILKKANTRAAIIGTVDLVAGAAGGRIYKALQKTAGKGIIGKGLEKVGESVVGRVAPEMLGGAGGEAAAQVATTGKINPQEVFLEGLGETVNIGNIRSADGPLSPPTNLGGIPTVPAPEGDVITPEIIDGGSGPNFQYANSLEEVPEQYRASAKKRTVQTGILGKMGIGPTKEIYTYEIPVETVDITNQTESVTATPEELQAYRNGTLQDAERIAAIEDDARLIKEGAQTLDDLPDDPNYRAMVQLKLDQTAPQQTSEVDQALQQGSANIQSQTQDEFAQYLQDNHSDQLSQEQIYKLLTVRPELRERMLSESPEQWAKIFERNPDYRQQHNNIDNNKELRGTSNPAWTGISIGDPTNQSQTGREKGYVTLDVNSARQMAKNAEQTFKDLYKLLKNAGYNGHLKMPSTFSDLITRFDNIVIHGASKNDIELALPIIEEYFNQQGLNVESTKTGVDNKDSNGKETSHTNLLAERVKNKQLTQSNATAQPTQTPIAPLPSPAAGNQVVAEFTPAYEGQVVLIKGEKGTVVKEENGNLVVETPSKIYELDDRGIEGIGAREISPKKPSEKQYTIEVQDDETALIDGQPYVINKDLRGNTISLTGENNTIRTGPALIETDIQRNKLETIQTPQQQAEEIQSLIPEATIDKQQMVDDIVGQNMTQRVATLLDQGLNENTTEQDLLQVKLWAEATIADLLTMQKGNPYADAQIESIQETLNILYHEYYSKGGKFTSEGGEQSQAEGNSKPKSKERVKRTKVAKVANAPTSPPTASSNLDGRLPPQVGTENVAVSPEVVPVASETRPVATKGTTQEGPANAVPLPQVGEVEQTAPEVVKQIAGQFLNIDRLVAKGFVKYVDSKTGKPCAKFGMRDNAFSRGGKWEIVKDLKGYATHEKGGVDLTIDGKGVRMGGKDSKLYAADGLLMPNNGGPIPVEKKQQLAEEERVNFLKYMDDPTYKKRLGAELFGDKFNNLPEQTKLVESEYAKRRNDIEKIPISQADIGSDYGFYTTPYYAGRRKNPQGTIQITNVDKPTPDHPSQNEGTYRQVVAHELGHASHRGDVAGEYERDSTFEQLVEKYHDKDREKLADLFNPNLGWATNKEKKEIYEAANKLLGAEQVQKILKKKEELDLEVEQKQKQYGDKYDPNIHGPFYPEEFTKIIDTARYNHLKQNPTEIATRMIGIRRLAADKFGYDFNTPFDISKYKEPIRKYLKENNMIDEVSDLDTILKLSDDQINEMMKYIAKNNDNENGEVYG